MLLGLCNFAGRGLLVALATVLESTFVFVRQLGGYMRMQVCCIVDVWKRDGIDSVQYISTVERGRALRGRPDLDVHLADSK